LWLAARQRDPQEWTDSCRGQKHENKKAVVAPAPLNPLYLCPRGRGVTEDSCKDGEPVIHRRGLQPNFRFEEVCTGRESGRMGGRSLSVMICKRNTPCKKKEPEPPASPLQCKSTAQQVRPQQAASDTALRRGRFWPPCGDLGRSPGLRCGGLGRCTSRACREGCPASAACPGMRSTLCCCCSRSASTGTILDPPPSQLPLGRRSCNSRRT